MFAIFLFFRSVLVVIEKIMIRMWVFLFIFFCHVFESSQTHARKNLHLRYWVLTYLFFFYILWYLILYQLKVYFCISDNLRRRIKWRCLIYVIWLIQYHRARMCRWLSVNHNIRYKQIHGNTQSQWFFF